MSSDNNGNTSSASASSSPTPNPIPARQKFRFRSRQIYLQEQQVSHKQPAAEAAVAVDDNKSNSHSCSLPSNTASAVSTAFPTSVAKHEISHQENKTIFVTARDIDKHGAYLHLLHLRHCTLYITSTTQALHLSQLDSCHVYSGPTVGSILIHECRHCQFSFITSQLRIHHTNHTSFYLYAKSPPIIEHCQAVSFHDQVLFSYPNLQDQTNTTQLSSLYHPNQALNVQDFNWLRTQQSPNWNIINAQEIPSPSIIQISQEALPQIDEATA